MKRTVIALILGSMSLFTGCNGSAGTAADGSDNTLANGFVDKYESASADPNHLTLALKYVAYTDSAGKPIVTQEEVQKAVDQANKLYSQCNFHVRVEEYVQANPAQYGFDYNTSSMAELTPIRKQFDDPRFLVVTATGKWAGMGSANAWAMMPGETPSGVVMESTVADNGNIIAHELGHYLGLDHTSGDNSLMMNPIIYSTSTRITKSQCETMREVAKSEYRNQALR